MRSPEAREDENEDESPLAPRPSGTARIRSGLRRHGIIPRPIELRELLRAPDLRFTTGNEIVLLRNGATGLEAMLRAIESASERIHLETYMFKSDATGWQFIEALAERARLGIEVRLLYDAVGSRGIDPNAISTLREAGADVTAFNPLRRFYPQWAPRRRDHRKILVVDGAVAFTGGLNIGDDYRLGPLHDGRRIEWRDAHLRVTGPAVRFLEAVFLESWFRADGPDRPWMELHSPHVEHPGGCTVGVIADGPTYHRRRMRDLIVEALERASHSALFVTPYFVPGTRTRRALVDAADRGVDVMILLAGYSDHPLLRWAARGRIETLLERGVRVYEFERAMMHAKVAVFDERLAVVGTSNLDSQSLQHSYEVNLAIEHSDAPAEILAMVRSDLGDAIELTHARLASRSRLAQLRDKCAAALVSMW